MDLNTKRTLIDEDEKLPVIQQCEVLGMCRSSWYFEPKPISGEELKIMQEIDMIHTDFDYYGHRKIWKTLINRGFDVGRDRVLNYMGIMSIEPYYPKAKTTIPNKQHTVYPYLLKGLDINRPNQVWSADITYIRMEKGFCYLVAIIDWYSRCILSYRLSTMLDVSFCTEALHEALGKYPAPEIFNTDQGSQFTSSVFTKILLDHNILISMDGKGRAIDNIIIERFFRSLKYEDIYRREYRSINELKIGIAKYMAGYNHFRLHETLGYKTPAVLYGIQNNDASRREMFMFTKMSQFLSFAA